MERQALIDEFVHLGVDAAQARAYVHLVEHGPLKATELAPVLGVSRPHTYRVLEQMAAAGLVTLTLERPARYVAVEASLLLSALAASSRERAAQAERLRTALGEVVFAPAAGTAAAAHRFRVLPGRRAYEGALSDMLLRARSEHLFADTGPEERAGARRAAAWDAKRRAVEAGLRVRAVVRPSPATRLLVAELARHGGADVRAATTHAPVRFDIVDAREILVGFPFSDTEQDKESGLWTDAPGFVRAQAELFERLWQTSEPLLDPAPRRSTQRRGS